MSGDAPRPAIGVSAIVVDDAGRMLLIQRRKPPAAGFWHAPGGRLEAGESMTDACRREVREETGMDVRLGSLLAVVERRIEGFHYVILDFFARPLDAGLALHAGDDAQAAAWFDWPALQTVPIADGLLPILERAQRLHRGEVLGLADLDGTATDFLPR